MPVLKRRSMSAGRAAWTSNRTPPGTTTARPTRLAGLDDAGVDGADGDLVDLFALDSIEVHDADCGLGDGAAPDVGARAEGSDESHRFEPGVPLGQEVPLLGDLALEEVRLRAIGRE